MEKCVVKYAIEISRVHGGDVGNFVKVVCSILAEVWSRLDEIDAAFPKYL